MPTREINAEVRKPTEAEIIAEQIERRIVRFKNIDNESFTHGFRGVTITIKAGEEYNCRFPEGDHLAKHLARKILSRDKKAKGADKDYKGSALWTPEEIELLKGKIITDMGTEDKTVSTQEEMRKKDLEELNAKYPTNPAPATQTPPATPAPQAPATPPKKVEVSREEILADLTKRGIKPDLKMSNKQLLETLMEAESQGQ